MVTCHHETSGPALVQRTEQVEHGHAQHPRHHAGRETVARHRGGLQQRLGGLRHLGQAVGRRVDYPSRHRAGPAAALAGEHPRQLTDQERVAARLGSHLIHLFNRGGQSGGPQQIPDGRDSQAVQVYPFRVGLGREAEQDLIARSRRGPVAGEDQDAGPAQLAHQIGEQDRRRLVSPLQIIEHQQQPARSGRLGQPPAHLGE
jgi:hypothetical protein